jgi:hypothetical protein
MRYRIKSALWEALAKEERSMGWLARQIGYTAAHVRRLHVEACRQVRERFAIGAAAALKRPVEELFDPVEPVEGASDDDD